MTAIAKTAPFVAACFLTAAPLLAADGLLIVQRHTSGGTTRTNQIQIEKTRMRAETGGASGRSQIVVFDATAQVIRIIDPEKKTYTEMTKADIDRLSGQMAGVMAQMQEQMKNLPPEQRERMEAMMRGRGVANAIPGLVKTEYRRNGTDKAGRWTCDKYDGYQKDQKVAEICTVTPATLGVTVADFDILTQAARFFQQLAPQNAGQLFSIGGTQQGFSGIPVRSTMSIGPQQITTELSSVIRKTFSDESYAVPEGFQKQSFPGGRRGRQQ